MGVCPTVWADLRSLQLDEDQDKPAIKIKCRSCDYSIWFAPNEIDPDASVFKCRNYMCGIAWNLKLVRENQHRYHHWFYTIYPERTELWVMELVDNIPGVPAFNRTRRANAKECKESSFEELQRLRRKRAGP